MYYWYGDNPNCGRCGHLNGQGFCNMTACPYPMIESSTLVVNPITNYDRIVSKTPEELANYLYELTIYGCPDHGARDCVPSCEACWLDWLKQEVTE